MKYVPPGHVASATAVARDVVLDDEVVGVAFRRDVYAGYSAEVIEIRRGGVD
jgi:hypothetical protein